MLQQTQVKTVMPYWQRWMRELPTLQALARARPEKILKLWEGLGYYTRARNLQKAAQLIVAKHQGCFPHEYDAVLALPGIGRYTAGAVCSIAFNQPTPILDGNVVRVLTRIFGITENPRAQTTNHKLWEMAEALVLTAAHDTQYVSRNMFPTSRITHSPRCRAVAAGHASSCSHLNQSLMELGALICAPKQPKCDQCPVLKHCAAHRTGKVEEIPNLSQRVRSTARRFVAFVVEKRGRLLVGQRPSGVVNAHLWEFPNFELVDGFDLNRAAQNALGMAPTSLQPVCIVKHSITRYRITLEVYRAELKLPTAKTRQPGRWLTRAELKPLAFTSAHRKIVEQLSRRASQPK